MRATLFFAFLCTVGSTQQQVVVPAVFASAEAPEMSMIAGSGASTRQQILIDSLHLQGMVNRQITALQFRRDTSSRRAKQAGQVQLTVRLGVSPNPASSPSRDPDRNLTGAVQTFQGIVQLPASPAVTGYMGWAPPYSVEIRFSTPFRYTGGTLCIDLDGSPVGAPTWWPVDAAVDPVRGGVISHGTACGPFAIGDGRVSFVAPRDLVPGETALFYSRGKTGSAGFMMLGLTLRTVPLELGLIGSPGCWVYVDALSALGTVFGIEELGPQAGGLGNVLVDIPVNPRLLDATFAVQWVDIGPPLTTSNALLCQISRSLPSSGMGMLHRDHGASEGTINLTKAPIVRFELQ